MYRTHIQLSEVDRNTSVKIRSNYLSESMILDREEINLGRSTLDVKSLVRTEHRVAIVN